MPLVYAQRTHNKLMQMIAIIAARFKAATAVILYL